MKAVLSGFCLVLIMVGGPLSAQERMESAFAAAIEVAKNRDLSNESRLARLNDILRTHEMGTKGVASDSIEAQRDLFMALDVLVSYSFVYSDPAINQHIEKMREMYGRLEAAGHADKQIQQSMYRTFLASWDIAGTKKLLETHHGLDGQQLPIESLLVGSSYVFGAPSQVNILENHAAVESVNLQRGKYIIVVAGCGVSDRAATEVDSNPRLREAFHRGNAIWLAPASKEIDPSQILDWNSKNPRQRITVAFRNHDWPGIDFSGAPSFYFYESGRLVASHHGWSVDGTTPSGVMKGLELLGLVE